ncbi:RNA polymerase sigma-70 factor, ECF subfamily [Pseudarcicella hirudinis]|uniref:RNA polymerase sigma-70 factor, ECF subfamily n=1 Tax=Pseudarcicella hirudinis TaxID=1079859 RepID=A0A1I5VUV4_9BACT|nr:RNA polymerase sigma-70 factor [Pseudarcicella hirudinis]SFQ11183.1 RNA polymerase sigma-70 factor, ECF subfamily [Pseudarcicella hirudinis]
MEYALLSDELLIKLLKTGDESAFQEIYNRYWKKLFHVALRKIQSRETVQEILQDLFVRLWEKKDQLQISQLNYYLFASLRYQIINHIKSQIVEEKYVSYAQNLAQDAFNPTEEQVALSELTAAIDSAIAQLPEKTREIFKLNHIEHKSVREISELLSIPERTIQHHLAKSLKILQTHLQEFTSFAMILILLQGE